MEIMEDSKGFEILRNAFEQQLINDGFVEHSGYSLEKNHINAYIDERVECAWFACLQGYRLAKAQAVPETQQALNDRLLVKSIREHVESHIAEISVNDLFDKGWLAAMKCIQNNIDMVDAAGIAISEAEKIFQTERDKALREQGFTHE